MKNHTLLIFFVAFVPKIFSISIGLSEKIERRDIVIEKNVFVGSHCVIKGGAYIGHHSVIAAGTIVEAVKINPYSLVIGNPMQIKDGYYKDKI